MIINTDVNPINPLLPMEPITSPKNCVLQNYAHESWCEVKFEKTSINNSKSDFRE
jgi:hypothetical protein